MLAVVLLAFLVAYFAAGVVFAVAFVWVGVEHVDSQARGSSAGFRALIFPGSAALWPLLLRRWLAGRPDPPAERNAHRRAALQRFAP